MFIDDLNHVRQFRGLEPVSNGSNIHEALTELDSIAGVDTSGGLKQNFVYGVVARIEVGKRLAFHRNRLFCHDGEADVCRCGCQH